MPGAVDPLACHESARPWSRRPGRRTTQLV